jgi:hypothetical protein
LRMLTVVDCYTPECLSIDVGQSLKGEDVAESLKRICAERGLPKTIKTDYVLTARGENPQGNSIRYRGALAARRYKRASSSTSCLPRSTGSLTDHSGNKIRHSACCVVFNVPKTA